MNQDTGLARNEGFNRAIEFIGGKWKMQILWALKDGAMRFTTLKETLSPITQKMLATALKELEADGLVNREVFSVVPPRVEYSVTPLFGNLEDALEIISQWGKQNAKPTESHITIPVVNTETVNQEIIQPTHTPFVAEPENRSEEPVVEETEPIQKRESFLKKSDKPTRISHLFK